MDTDIEGLAERILAEYANRGLGDVELASDRALQRYSRAGQDGAQNLVDKVFGALENGDRDRARRYLGIASRLPFDDREGSHPLAWTVHMELFVVITDAVESAEEHDRDWLEAAIALLDSTDGPARVELRHVLATIDHDYHLDKADRRDLRAAIAGLREQPSLADQELSEDELAESALAVIDLCRAYHQAMEHSVD